MLLLSKNGIDSTVGASEVPVFVRSLRVVTRFTLTWWVPADIAGVSVWNIVLQQAHAGAMLPAQTVFTLKGGEKNTTLYNRQTLWWNKHLQCLKKNTQEVIKKAHLDHEVILFLHFTDTSHYLLFIGVHSARVQTQRWCCDVQIHAIVVVAPPTTVSGPVTDAILIYSHSDKPSFGF